MTFTINALHAALPSSGTSALTLPAAALRLPLVRFTTVHHHTTADWTGLHGSRVPGQNGVVYDPDMRCETKAVFLILFSFAGALCSGSRAFPKGVDAGLLPARMPFCRERSPASTVTCHASWLPVAIPMQFLLSPAMTQRCRPRGHHDTLPRRPFARAIHITRCLPVCKRCSTAIHRLPLNMRLPPSIGPTEQHIVSRRSISYALSVVFSQLLWWRSRAALFDWIQRGGWRQLALFVHSLAQMGEPAFCATFFLLL